MSLNNSKINNCLNNQKNKKINLISDKKYSNNNHPKNNESYRTDYIQLKKNF